MATGYPRRHRLPKLLSDKGIIVNWGFRSKSGQVEDIVARRTLAEALASAEHKGEILNRCKSDVERRSLCLQWASKARTDWYDGQRQQVVFVLLSDSPRYRDYPAKVRQSIGEQQWGKSVEAKSLADLEQMYCRWALMYHGEA